MPKVVRVVDEGLELAGAVARALARAYDLRHDEVPTFDAGWKVYGSIVEVGAAAKRARKERAEQAVDAAMGQLAAAIRTTHGDGQRGSSRVRHLPAEGRYVVFSDHHFTYRGHRSNFFFAGGCLPIYVEALRQYDASDFTLVENGDVEDLVIFDPRFSPGEAERRQDMTLAELEARRLVLRLEQLGWILADAVNQPVLEAQRAFHRRGALVKVAGNHDYDLQRADFLDVYRAAFPDLEAPFDYVLLQRGSDPTDVSHAILHGHQFDPACAPAVASELGETISETLGLWFQGPDRHWLWNVDGPERWARGGAPFLNQLAAPPSALVHEGMLALFERVRGGLTNDLATLLAHGAGALGSGSAGGWPGLPQLMELLINELSGENIAWDYFINRRPLPAVVEEVLPGDRFFKFRVLDEELVRAQRDAAFPEGARPTLILGHTHEVRFHPWSRAVNTSVPYLNSGSAGRFENLVFALELDRGVERLVSWSMDGGVARRRVWRQLDRNHVVADAADVSVADGAA